MPARKDNDAEAPAIVPVPEADIAELLDNGTVRSTNTEYEDRTYNPLEDAPVEYESIETPLDSGTVLTTYMEPIGGFPEAE